MIQRESNDLPFSVFIPTYNSAQYLEETIQSIEDQDKELFEVFIIDGGSSDETLQIAHSSNDLNVTTVIEPGAPPLVAIQKNLGLMNGKYFIFLGSDDKLNSRFFSSLNGVLLQNSQKFDLLRYGLDYIGPSGERLPSVISYSPSATNHLSLIDAAYGPCVNIAFNRNLFSRLGFFDQIKWGHAADREYLLRLSLNRVSVGNSSEACYSFRRHPRSTTGNGNKSVQLRDLENCKRIAVNYIDETESIDQQKELKEWFGYCWVREVALLIFSFKFWAAMIIFFGGIAMYPKQCMTGVINFSYHRIKSSRS